MSTSEGVAPTPQRRTRTVADLSTGETLVLKAQPAPPRHGQGFTLMFQADLLALLRSDVGRSLSALELRVLLLLCSLMTYDNAVRSSKAEMAKQLGAYRSSVSRAVKVLAGHGLLREEPGLQPGDSVLRVNPHLVYRGNVQERRAAVVRDVWAPSGRDFAGETALERSS